MVEITLDQWPGWSNEFSLVYRQELSGQANGVSIGKDFGTPVWRGVWTTKDLRPNALDYWRARLEALQGSMGTFYGYPLSRWYPSAHANGVGLPGGTVTVSAIALDYSTVSLAGASGLTLNIGDMISIADRLYRCIQASTGGSAFKVAPYIFPDVTTGMTVRVTNPRCIMRVVPGSFAAPSGLNGRGTVSFEALQAL